MSVRFLRADDPEVGATLKQDGVVFIEELLTSEEIQETRDALARYEREILPSVPFAYRHYYGDGTLRSMLDIHRYDPWFRELGNRPRIMNMVRNAVSWDPAFHYMESVPKPPGAGPVMAHQELNTNPIDPPHFLHLWIPLENVTAANGGMNFYRGSHRLGLAPHVDTGIDAAYQVDAKILERMRPYLLEPDFPAGSAALFDGFTIHRSGPNLSDSPRPVVIAAFIDPEASVASETDHIASRIARFFRDEIGVKQCAVSDDFFKVGGDPSAASRVLDRLREDYGVHIPVQDMSTYGTPQALAERTTELSFEGVGG